jgi:hypothetical protein
MSENKPAPQDSSGKAECENCRRSREHLSVLLPFGVVEKIVDKPLRIRGVAMAVGMSRNSNIYTSEELQAFGSKLVGAPVYVEHVSVDKAVGKVMKTDWDGHALWYEADEIAVRTLGEGRSLVSALQKLVALNLVPADRKSGAHPSVAKRIKRIEQIMSQSFANAHGCSENGQKWSFPFFARVGGNPL